MTKTKIEDFKDDFSLLIEAGFIAVKQLDEISATRLFNAAQALSPGNTAPRIGLGYIALNKLEVKKATEIFQEVVEKEPENHIAQTFLGICYLLVKAKRKKGEKLIAEIKGKSKDPTVLNLCEVSLEWAEKDLSKAKSPFFDEGEPEEEVEKTTSK